MSTTSPRHAIVLAGGASTRMGRDKAFVDVAGETLAARTARVVGEVCDVVFVVGAPGRPLPLLPAGVVVAFDDARFGGPLAGVAAGLSALPSTASSHLLLVGVDFPRLRAEPLRALLELAPEDRAVALVRGPSLEPLPSWLPVERLRGALAASRIDRPLRALLRDLDVRAVTPEEVIATSPGLATLDPGLDSLRDADDEATLGTLLQTP
jgi:molybdopterin-guanine dinucleotide biosynthesis protein A